MNVEMKLDRRRIKLEQSPNEYKNYLFSIPYKKITNKQCDCEDKFYEQPKKYNKLNVDKLKEMLDDIKNIKKNVPENNIDYFMFDLSPCKSCTNPLGYTSFKGKFRIKETTDDSYIFCLKTNFKDFIIENIYTIVNRTKKYDENIDITFYKTKFIFKIEKDIYEKNKPWEIKMDGLNEGKKIFLNCLVYNKFVNN